MDNVIPLFGTCWNSGCNNPVVKDDRCQECLDARAINGSIARHIRNHMKHCKRNNCLLCFSNAMGYGDAIDHIAGG